MTKLANPPVALEDQLCFAIDSAGIAIQRAYNPLLDELGLTYPQYLVLNVLWRRDSQTVGAIAQKLALESSTLTPILKRLAAASLVHRTVDPANGRQVIIALTDEGKALRSRAGCLGDALLEASGQTPAVLARLNGEISQLRAAVYDHIGEWSVSDTPTDTA